MAYSYPYYPQQGYQTSYPQYQPQDQLTQLRMAQQPQQQSGGIIWVGSEQEACGYPVAPNSAAVLWNSNAPVVYLKQADASGRPTIKAYDLVERSAAPRANAEPGGEYAPLDAVNALTARVEQLAARVEQLSAKPTKNKEVKADE